MLLWQWIPSAFYGLFVTRSRALRLTTLSPFALGAFFVFAWLVGAFPSMVAGTSRATPKTPKTGVAHKRVKDKKTEPRHRGALREREL